MNQAATLLKRLLLLLGVAAFWSGCMRDDRSDCLYPLRLQFSYTYNTEHTDLFDREIRTLDLFLYDRCTGQLVATASPDPGGLSPENIYEWLVPPGDYEVVAWAGVDRAHGFYAVENIGNHVFYRRREDDRIVPQVEEHIFHAAATAVITGDVSPVHPMELYKNTNNVTVKVRGLSADKAAELACTVASTNGAYRADNSVCAEHPLTYLPAVQRDGTVEFLFTVHRLWKGDDSHLQVTLAGSSDGPAYAAGGSVYDGSLSGLLLENPDTDLDLDDEFVVEFEVGPDSSGNRIVGIYVNGWKVIDMDEGIG